MGDIYIKEPKSGRRRWRKKGGQTFEGALLLQRLRNKPLGKEKGTLSLAKFKMFVLCLWSSVSATITENKGSVKLFLFGLWSFISATIAKNDKKMKSYFKRKELSK